MNTTINTQIQELVKMFLAGLISEKVFNLKSVDLLANTNNK